MAKFKHRWKSPLGIDSTWRKIAECFRSSNRSSIWPKEMAEVSTLGGKVAQGASVVVLYKFGSIHQEAFYRIAAFEPPHRLRYETREGHPLRGFATIRLRSVADGTECEWSGEYHRKGFGSLISLVWFKLYYERRFFKKFISNFEKLSRERESSKAA